MEDMTTHAGISTYLNTAVWRKVHIDRFLQDARRGINRVLLKKSRILPALESSIDQLKQRPDFSPAQLYVTKLGKTLTSFYPRAVAYLLPKTLEANDFLDAAYSHGIPRRGLNTALNDILSMYDTNVFHALEDAGMPASIEEFGIISGMTTQAVFAERVRILLSDPEIRPENDAIIDDVKNEILKPKKQR